LFAEYVNKSPVLYYRDIRLDRARCLVTQTDMKLADIAVASGFVSQAHFSRIYSERFGLAPSRDRVEGRVPFEFRAWPMHNPAAAQSTD
jgi:AraC family carnitine catabolism transcriptional activator